MAKKAQASKRSEVTSAGVPLADIAILIGVTVMVSSAFFANVRQVLIDAGYTSMSVGPFALALGLIAGAMGLGWRRKLVFAAALVGVFALMSLGGSVLWFGEFKFGDLATAPAELTAATTLPFLVYAMFAFLPWAAPVVVLVWFLGGDPRALWRRAGR